MLSHIWFGFFAVAFVSAMYQWLVNGHAAIFSEIMQMAAWPLTSH